MNQLKRSTALKIAAVISLGVATIGIVFYDLPNLMLGAAASLDPFPLVLGSFATDILAFVAAYGAWRNQRWGAILLLLITAFWVIQALLTLLFSTSTIDTVFSTVMMAVHILAIVLCLWREPVAVNRHAI